MLFPPIRRNIRSMAAQPGIKGAANAVCAFNLLMRIPEKTSGICSFPVMISLAEWHILKKEGDPY
jgi:hypothetical protein